MPGWVQMSGKGPNGVQYAGDGFFVVRFRAG
jgi:hypothetical protein